MTHAEILMTAVGLLLCGALLSAVLRTQRPELALCLSLLAGVLVVGMLLGQLSPLLTALRRMTALWSSPALPIMSPPTRSPT